MSLPVLRGRGEIGPSGKILTGVAAIVTLFVLAGLFLTVGLLAEPVIVGTFGAISIVSGGAIIQTRDTVRAQCVGTALGIGGGTATFSAIVGSGLLLIEETFPVETPAHISIGAVTVLSHVLIVVGTILVVYGLALTVRRLTTETIRRLMWLLGLAWVPAAVCAVVLLWAGILGTGPPDVYIDTVRTTIAEIIVSPASPGIHLWSLLALMALVFGIAARLGQPREHARNLEFATVVTGVLAVLTLFLELVVTPVELLTLLGPGYDAIRLLTLWSPLRYVLAVIVLGVGSFLIIRTVSATLGARTHTFDPTAPLTVGLIATLGTLWIAPRLYTAVLGALVEYAPDQTESDILESSATITETAGESTVMLASLLLVILTSGGIVGMTYLAREYRFISPRDTGPTLIGIGIFITVPFGAVLDISTWYILGGIGAGLLVWTIGHYHAVLEAEIPAGEVTRIESLNLLVSIGIAILAVGLAALLGSWAPAIDRALSTTLLALTCLFVGLLSLALALR